MYELFKEGLARVVLVDNHCKDGVKELISSSYPWVTYKASPKNLGFGYGCNLGFSIFDSEYTLFLNPDAVINKEEINKLVNFLEVSTCADMVGPATKVRSGWQRAGMMPTPSIFKRHDEHFNGRIIEPNKKPFETNWLCGAILLIRSRVFKSIGGFDERFFLYFEETDLCKRLRENDYQIWAIGQAIAEHPGGESSKDSDELKISGCIAEHYYKSKFYFFKKHYGWLRAVLVEIADVAVIFLRGIKKAILLKRSPFKEFLARIKHDFFSMP